MRARHAGDSGVSRGGGRSSIWCEKRHGWSLERDAACAAADGFATGAAVSQPPATPPNAIFIEYLHDGRARTPLYHVPYNLQQRQSLSWWFSPHYCHFLID